jgi:hypothetical protein
VLCAKRRRDGEQQTGGGSRVDRCRGRRSGAERDRPAFSGSGCDADERQRFDIARADCVPDAPIVRKWTKNCASHIVFVKTFASSGPAAIDAPSEVPPVAVPKIGVKVTVWPAVTRSS